MQVIEKPRTSFVECIHKGLYSYFVPEAVKAKVLNKSTPKVSNEANGFRPRMFFMMF